MNNITNFYSSYQMSLIQLNINQILETNKQSSEYGMILSTEDAKDLITTRNELLNSLGRVEIGGGTINKIISEFQDSQYLWQDNYAETLNELLEIFYYIKNESEDLIGDNELIELMKKLFNGKYEGSLYLLQSGELEDIARTMRYKNQNIHIDKEENKEYYEDEDYYDDFEEGY